MELHRMHSKAHALIEYIDAVLDSNMKFVSVTDAFSFVVEYG